jgi:hypothetical protein
MKRKFGDIFWSPYFESKGVVVSYIDDDNWYFVLKQKPDRVMRAQCKPEKLQWYVICEGG